MKIDTLKKRAINKTEEIDLRTNKKDSDKVILKQRNKSSSFNNSDMVFYILLIISMIFIFIVWSLSFKNNLKETEKKSLENKAKYEKIINTYNDTKKEIDKGVENIKNQLEANKKENKESSFIIDNIKEEDRLKIINNLKESQTTTPADQEIQNSLNQKELQYKLDTINN